MLSFIALRDGKIDYEDEQGNAILAPWMLPPDEPSVHLHSKGNMNMNINSNNIHHLGNMTGNMTGNMNINNMSNNNNNMMMRGHSNVSGGGVDPHTSSSFIPSGQLHHPYGFIQYNATGPAYVNDPRVSGIRECSLCDMFVCCAFLLL